METLIQFKHIFKLYDKVNIIDIDSNNINIFTILFKQMEKSYKLYLYDYYLLDRVTDIDHLSFGKYYLYIKIDQWKVVKLIESKFDITYHYNKDSKSVNKLMITEFSNLNFNFIAMFNNLISLSLPHNRLKKIPISIFTLFNLKTLILDNNLITHLPEDIILNQNLEELFLWNNKIGFITEKIDKCKKLVTISLSNNLLTEIPKQLFEIKSLRQIILTNNLLVKIPKKAYLTNTHLKGNPVYSKDT